MDVVTRQKISNDHTMTKLVYLCKRTYALNCAHEHIREKPPGAEGSKFDWLIYQLRNNVKVFCDISVLTITHNLTIMSHFTCTKLSP